MSAFFRNPSNGYVVKATGDFTWLWAFLFGPFYFGFKGLWGHSALWVLAAFVTIGWSLLIYPFFAKSLVAKRYQELGWERSDRDPRKARKPAFFPPPDAPQGSIDWNWLGSPRGFVAAGVLALLFGASLPVVVELGKRRMSNVVAALPSPAETGSVTRATLTQAPSVNQPTAVPGQREGMPYAKCLASIRQLATQTGTAPTNIIETDNLRVVRFPAADGSMLVTCNGLEGFRVINLSSNTCGVDVNC
jgi:hypothetical protein